MTLKELPDVRIDPVGGYKFIIAAVTDPDGNVKPVVRADQNCEYHRDILAKLRAETPGFRVQCLGGGRIKTDPALKIITISGASGDFGREPDRNVTVRLLREAFPEFNVLAMTGW